MLVFEANTAEEFREEVVDYLEGLLSLEEIRLCQRAPKRDQHDTEARRDFLIVLSENLKGAALKAR